MYGNGALQVIPAAELDTDMPIFHLLEADYPDVHLWLEAIRQDRENRLIILSADAAGNYEGIAIVKLQEYSTEYGLGSPVTKISTFLIREDCRAQGLGNKMMALITSLTSQTLYVEVFPWKQDFIHFIRKHQFVESPFTSYKNENVYYLTR